MQAVTYLTPRYAPTTDLFQTAQGFRYLPVSRFIVHPAGNHPAACPLIRDCVAIELQADGAIRSRWYGIESGHINSELRMVVIGTDPRDEVRSKWEVCHEV